VVESSFQTLSLVFASVHYLIVLVCSYVAMRIIMQRGVSIIFSPHACFFIVSELYFSASVLKYFRLDEGGFGFLGVTRIEQFVGYLIGQITLIILAFKIDGQKQLGKERFDRFFIESKTAISILALSFAVISAAVKITLLANGYGSTYTEAEYNKISLRADQDSIWINTAEILDQITWVLALIGFFSAPSSWHGARRLLYLSILIITAFASVYISRSRLAIGVFFIIGLIVYQWVQPKKGVQYIFSVIILAPLFLLTMPLIGFVLSRDNITGDNYTESMIESSYRADLTDFAYLVCKNTSIIQVDLSLVNNGILNAVPSVVLKSKRDFLVDQYAVNLDRLGLVSRNSAGQELVDYQDSYFSSGVMCFGWIGFIFMPILFVEIGSLVLKIVLRGNLTFDKVLIAIPFGLMFLRIEVEYGNIIINFRNAFQSSVIISVLWYAIKYILRGNQVSNGLHRGWTRVAN
jgi:hypothetical protein